MSKIGYKMTLLKPDSTNDEKFICMGIKFLGWKLLMLDKLDHGSIMAQVAYSHTLLEWTGKEQRSSIARRSSGI